jgi:hypothetical protein
MISLDQTSEVILNSSFQMEYVVDNAVANWNSLGSFHQYLINDIATTTRTTKPFSPKQVAVDETHRSRKQRQKQR